MKRFSLLLLLVVATFGLSSCKKDEPKEFAVDGQFTAYQAEVHNNAPQVTFVTVTVKNGKITGYNIDVRQGMRTAPVLEGGDFTFAWNEKTKKELGDAYGMKNIGPGYVLVDGVWTVEGKSKTEWFEQAAKIEAYLLKNGVESLDNTLIDGRFNPGLDGLAGVTIKNAYLDIAKASVALAKAGKFQSILCSGTDLYSASMTVDSKGKVSELVLDTLQATVDVKTGTFVWKDKTKQELQFDYNMKKFGTGYKFENGAWVSSGEKPLNEWFEQANLITKYVMEKGWSSKIVSIKDAGGTGKGLSIDGKTLVDGYAGVTMNTDNYYKVLGNLYAKAGK